MTQNPILKHQSQCDAVLFMGDIHGQWNGMYSKFKRMGLENCVVVACGDFGIGWEERYKEEKSIKYLDALLANRNIHLYVLRGNHDDPSYYDGYFHFPNIKLMEDYTVLEIGSWRILTIGGAHSVDRMNRKDWYLYNGRKSELRDKKRLNRGWWPDEKFIFEPHLLEGLRNIDVVATHTSPQMVPPMHMDGLTFWSHNDKDIVEDVSQERMEMNLVFEILHKNNKLMSWYYGHYHDSTSITVFGTHFKCLDIDEIYEEKIMRNAI